MNPALWGSLSALSLGGADFIARFTSRGCGAASALFAMLLVGSLLLSGWIWLTGVPLVLDPAGWWLLALNGLATTVMTLLLYMGLARGPVSIVAPIVASYPALVVALAVVLGARPSAIQWAAMATTVAGVMVVATSAGKFEKPGVTSRRDLRVTVLIALSASLAYAVLVSAGQAAVPIYGDLQTLYLGRLISFAAICLVFLVRRTAPTVPRAFWPVVAAQGLLDAAGYLFLFAGSGGEGAEIAAVTGSTFGVVVTLLARIVLREAIGLVQWFGVALVFVGVAVLTAYSQ